MAWLLDTNVISELRRPRPEPNVLAFLHACVPEDLYLSTVTMAEIRFGILRSRTEEQRHLLDLWLESSIRPMFRGRVLPLSESVMVRWRILVEAGRQVRRTYPEPDLLLAATAVEHDLALVTRNTRDFEDLPIQLRNPWLS